MKPNIVFLTRTARTIIAMPFILLIIVLALSVVGLFFLIKFIIEDNYG